jgi:predicted N-acetyltransferase YhbS
MTSGRQLFREEIEKVWAIDRSEVVDNIYCFENGTLVLKPDHYDINGWPPGEAEKYSPHLVECFDKGGWFYGLFDGGLIIGVVILEARFIGQSKDRLQLKFLHVSKAYRGQGLGKQLFELAKTEAHMRGAKRIYISATPSENTINFYRRLGCVLTQELDPELFALEPEDLHLECEI